MTVSPCPHRTPPTGRRRPGLASSPCVLNIWARGKRKARPGAGLNRTAGRWNPCPGAQSAQRAPSRRPSPRPWGRDGGDQTCLSGRRRSASKPGWSRPQGRWSSPEPPGGSRSAGHSVAHLGGSRPSLWSASLAPVGRSCQTSGPRSGWACPRGRTAPGTFPLCLLQDPRAAAAELRDEPRPGPAAVVFKEAGPQPQEDPGQELCGSQVCCVCFLACLEVKGR